MSSVDDALIKMDSSSAVNALYDDNFKNSSEKIPLLLEPAEDAESDSDRYVLKRRMTFGNGFAYVVGMLLGSGVFISPGLVAKRTPNMFTAMVVWIVSGLISMLGASVYCELASLFPKTGSTYIFVHETLGKLPAFLLLWTYFWIITPTSLAVITFTTGSYLVTPFFDDHTDASFVWAAKAVGFTIFLGLSIVNCLGVRQFGKAQYVFVFSQASVIVLIFGMGIYRIASTRDTTNFTPSALFGNTSDLLTYDGLHLIGLSFYNALWAYDGWGSLPYLAEELQNPVENIPLLTFTSIPTVTGAYILLNLAFMTTLSRHEMAQSETVGTSMAQKIFHTKYSFIMPVLVAFTCLGSISSSIFAVARFYLSAAREGQLPACFAWIHKERRTPIPSILINAVLTLSWLLVGSSAEMFITYFNFTLWFFYGSAFVCLLVLRYKRPEAERTYRVHLVTPIFMCCIAVILSLSSFLSVPFGSGMCVLFILSGLPIYYICIYKRFFKSDRFSWVGTASKKIQLSLNLIPCDVADPE